MSVEAPTTQLDTNPANIPAATAPIPNSLKLLLMLTEALQASCNWMADYCQNDQSAMDQLAVNDQLLAMANPALQAALLKIEQAAEAERTTDA